MISDVDAFKKEDGNGPICKPDNYIQKTVKNQYKKLWTAWFIGQPVRDQINSRVMG